MSTYQDHANDIVESIIPHNLRAIANTNDPAGSKDKLAAQDATESIGQRLEELDQIVERIQELRERGRADAYKLRCVLAPQRQLTDDVLSEIFLHTIMTNGDLSLPHICPKQRSSPNVLDMGKICTYTPWQLRQVCCRWRRVALNTVALWNQLVLVLGGHYPWTFGDSPKKTWSFQPRLNQVKNILSRTGPINLRILATPIGMCNSYWQEAEASALGGFIPALGARLTSLSLWLYHSGAVALLKLDSRPLSNLQNIHLGLQVFPMIDSFNELAAKSELFLHMTALTRLSLAGHIDNSEMIPRDVFWDYLRIPWMQIRSLSMVYNAFDDQACKSMYTTLKQCTTLEHLRLKYLGNSRDQWNADFEPIQLNELKSLDIDVDSQIFIFNSITAPSLRALFYVIHAQLPEAVALVRRSKCILETLNDNKEYPKRYYDRVCLSADDLKEPLHHVQDLQINARFTIKDFEDIIEGRTFPYLRTLNCHVPMTPDCFIDIFESAARRESGINRRIPLRQVQAVAEPGERVTPLDLDDFDARAWEFWDQTSIELIYKLQDKEY